MRIKRSIQVSSAILTVLALYALFFTSAQAATRPFNVGAPTLASAGTPTFVNANVYLSGQMLQPMFQTSINHSIPQMLSSALSSMVNQLPKEDQGWALQMAGALLQPSATLVSLKPQAGGLLTTLKVSLYQGDPKAITTSILIGFKVINASTIQVTALPSPNGGQNLVSGTLETFKVPIGSLNSIVTTPQCGDANLDINLNFPISLGQVGAATPTPAGNSSFIKTANYTRLANPVTNTKIAATPATNSYIELPSASLAKLGSSIGGIQISSSIKAQNIRVGVQGSNLLVNSDIYWHGLMVGTAVSTMVPGASNGNLVVHVLTTSLQIFGGLLDFPMNSYNQQIQQDLNTVLNGALKGTFYVNQATIGSNAHVTCAAANSLVLAGSITLG